MTSQLKCKGDADLGVQSISPIKMLHSDDSAVAVQRNPYALSHTPCVDKSLFAPMVNLAVPADSADLAASVCAL